MWYLINSWKLLSENPQPPSEKIHSPIFTHCPLPKKSETASPPVFAKIENILDPSPLQKGGEGGHCVGVGGWLKNFKLSVM